MRGGRGAVNKGKAMEREAVAIVRRRFPMAQRTGHQQGEGGKHKRPDIDGVPGVWLSVKSGKAPRVLPALEEADAAAGIDLTPAVAFRRDRGRWWVAVPLSYWLDREADASWPALPPGGGR